MSRYTVTGGSGITKAEVGFNSAAKKRSFRLFSFGAGVDSTENFPCRERVIRICNGMSQGEPEREKTRNNPVQYLVRLTKVLASQGRITSTLEPIKRELGGDGPRMSPGSRNQPVHSIREEKVR